jgi:hypothetical protein
VPALVRALLVVLVALALGQALRAPPPGGDARLGRPRTRHLAPDGSPRFTNRLALEESPYLLQHAHNPVDWYPWGEEAFARARAEGKPILLSVGYSTCHWCHVMEEESFEDEEIAAEMNADYVAIKVDRERRPDIDGVYMAAVQAMSGNGGWPMTVWLTPDRRPFYGGTYFPPRDGERGVRAGFLTLLRKLAAVYRERPADVAAAAADVTGRLERGLVPPPGGEMPDATLVTRAVAELKRSYDREHGGFGHAQKFPRPVDLELLLRYQRRTGDAEAGAMVAHTLEAMAAGGIHDQVGGGFHRYATDAAWRVPHFEKMLYDNALLAVAYLDGFQATGRADFAATARDTLDWVGREMTGPEGGFYSATDADSADGEGAYYRWTPDDLRAALAPADAALAGTYFGVDGPTILHVEQPLAEVVPDPADAAPRLAAIRRSLLDVRATRTPPDTDRKIVTAWNGLMISAFARGASVLDEPAYAVQATRAATFVLDRLRTGGRLRRSALAGRASGDAYLDDYAFLVAGLLDLFEATFEPRWLDEALALQGVLDEHYGDAAAGGYFLTADDHEALLVREKPSDDGAEPSGNSVAAMNLLRLAELTGDDGFRAKADATLRAFERLLRGSPNASPRMLAAVDFASDRAKEIVIVTPAGDTDAGPLLAELRAAYVPNRVLAVVEEGGAARALAPRVPLVAEKLALDGKPTAYVCEHRVCRLPTTEPRVFAGELTRVEPLPQ